MPPWKTPKLPPAPVGRDSVREQRLRLSRSLISGLSFLRSLRLRQAPMSKPKPWFVQFRNYYTAMPICWQGWALLIGVFAAEVLITRNLHGVVRAIAFFVIILLFFVVSRGKTMK